MFSSTSVLSLLSAGGAKLHRGKAEPVYPELCNQISVVKHSASVAEAISCFSSAMMTAPVSLQHDHQSLFTGPLSVGGVTLTLKQESTTCSGDGIPLELEFDGDEIILKDWDWKVKGQKKLPFDDKELEEIFKAKPKKKMDFLF